MLRMTIPALALAVLAAQAQAQTTEAPSPSSQPPVTSAPVNPPPAMSTPPTTMAPPAGSTTTTTGKKKHAHRTLEQQFSDANTSHDGHLTREQATAAHWTSVSRHFDAIDKDKKGYVTVDDIKASRASMTHKAKHKRAVPPAEAPAPASTPSPATAPAPATNG